MKWTSATALLVALSAAGAGATYVLTRRPMGPTEIIAQIRSEMGEVTFEQRTALRQLGLALTTAEGRQDDELVARVLETRSDVHLSLGDTESALTDLKRIARLHPSDFDLRLRIAGLMAGRGQVEEALKSARDMVEADPKLAPAWELVGQLEALLAAELLEPTLELIRKALVREDAEVATNLLTRLSHREERDPDNPALLFALEQVFPAADKELYYDSLLAVPVSRERFDASRSAFSRAIALEPSEARVSALAGALEQAGQRSVAIQVLMAARVVPSLRDSDALRFELARLLEASQRRNEARLILSETKWIQAEDLDYIMFAAHLFFELGVYGPLGPLANRMRQLGGETGVHWSNFFSSINPIQQALKDEDRSTWRERMTRASKDLRKFINDTTFPEPFPKARAHAGLWFSKVAQVQGKVEDEIFGLNIGLAQKELRTADACAQLATALARRTPTPWYEIDLALSDAIDLEPARFREFEEDWLTAGRRTIETKGMTLGDLVSEAERTNSAIPMVRGLGPAALSLLAAKHLDDATHYSALQVANKALKEHPDLIPALDLAIRAKLVTPSRYTVERDIVRRIQLAGLDEDVEDFLNLLPPGRFAGRAMVDAIEASPDRFGKSAVASWFLENGDSSKARALLGRLDQRTAPDALRLLRARALVEEGRFNAALEAINSIEASRRLGQEAALLKARILVELDRPQPLAQIVRQLDWVQASQETLLSLADLLMTNGQLDLALEIIDRLDLDAESRTAEFYRRRILIDILTVRTRGLDVARESIDRSEAYLRDGTPEIASILLSVTRRRWTELPKQIERLRSSSFEITPQKDVALILLAERLEAGRRLASAGMERNARDPLWALVAAAGDTMARAPISLPRWFGQASVADAERLLSGSVARSSRDPREALAVMLIADRPEWRPWLLPIIDKVRKETGSRTWTGYLEALVHEASGDVAGQTEAVEALVEHNRRFGPAHEWAIELAEARHPAEPLHPEIKLARNARLSSLGAELIDDPVQVALAEASDLAFRKDNASAVRKLRAVLAEAGDAEIEARLILGTLMIQANQPTEAASYLHEAAMSEPGIFRTVVVDSLLFSLRYAVQAEEKGTSQPGGIGKERALEMLNELSERYPLDPMVTLTRLELSGIPERRWGDWAQNALDQLYQRSDRQPLEALRRGSTRRWVKLLSGVRIDLARDLIERDLLHEPGNLELWNLRAEVASSMNDDVAAARIYNALMSIDPRSDLGYALAEIMIEGSSSMREINRTLQVSDSAQGGGGPRSNFLRSQAQIRMLNPDYAQLIQRLENTWRSREREATGLDPFALGELYVDALLRRNGPADTLPISKVLEELKKLAASVPYRAASIAAIEGLFTQSRREAGSI